MHMKESTPTLHTHLRNAINYILNEKKTRDGELVGGNAGLERQEILQNFLETKREYDKLFGRQGYHFVISFAKGETDEQAAYQIMQEFCEQYLGDHYDYVFAVHNDKEHLHGHIIFNSVSRTTGYKYHYKKGDWAKFIQPITDRLCKQHGLQPLTFEEERVGKSYAAYKSKKENGFDWQDIIRADIDYTVRQANSYDEFKEKLRKMGYVLGREGISKGRDYLSLKAEGMKRSWRTSSLGKGYGVSEIKKRIQAKTGPVSYEKLTEQMTVKAGTLLQSVTLKGTRTYHRMYQAVNYYKLPNPYAVPAHRVRRDMLRLERLLDECRYLKSSNLITAEKLTKRMQDVNAQLELLKIERKTLYGIYNQIDAKDKEVQTQYNLLKKQLRECEKTQNDDFEEVEDQIKELEELYPSEFLSMLSQIELYSSKISTLRKERRILQDLITAETEQQLQLRLQKKI